MRLVKINDIILNIDNIAVIRGNRVGKNYDGDVDVYAYSAGQKICLGHCDSQEDYQKWIDAVYAEFTDQFLGETISVEDDDEEELWK